MLKIVIFSIILLILVLSAFFLFNFKKEENLPETFKKAMSEETETKEIKEEISIITVYDNYQINQELRTGWGFSCLVKMPDKNILFDTGADSLTLLSNMEKLNIKPEEIDIIVLSHIHEDHTGGLEGFLEKNNRVKVYIPTSFPYSVREKIKFHKAEYVDVSKPIEIISDVYSTGELGTGIKEQSLVIISDKGLIVITGCAHPGIVNIIEKAKEMFLEKELYLVMGGFHLLSASDSELKNILEDFKNLKVQKVGPCHCSGDKTRELFKKEYQDNFIENGVGKIIKI